MNRDQKVVEIMRREVLWFLMGFGVAAVLMTNFHLGDWLTTHSGLFTLVVGACLLVGATFEWRVRSAKRT